MEAEQVGQSIFVLHVVEVKVFIASDSNLICTKRKQRSELAHIIGRLKDGTHYRQD